ncbi:MAG: glycolate oxidase subunit GlcF [Pseudomonadota bacterium]|uniref:glycolate oxidase subunit GlcF n=1 Tax=Rhizorhabdus phycosphaerae TaxID=2711156 RepID=UPI0013EB5809|nr:glycolate oxidase subunit GlcF [Rhizorhabdus phycosphaerae]
MRTDFTPEQLADPATAVAEAVIRKCVHCGFCTATCPTYVLLGDELDSPRGRIYLIQNMLEQEAEPTPQVVKHIDRCLSCLSCMTTCPSGVNYMHLVDHARAYIERRYRRPLAERMIRGLLAAVLPYPRRFRLALGLARLARPLAPLFRRSSRTRPLAAMLDLAPRSRPMQMPPQAPDAPEHPAGVVAVLEGCAEPVLRPQIRAATLRLLARLGYRTVSAPGEGCCGALVHHMGKEAAALEAARRNVDAWWRVIQQDGLDAILITASGCGTTVKDYGFLLRNDPAYAERAAHISVLARDISEFLAPLDLPTAGISGVTVAYHAACSLQHGQKLPDLPRKLLTAAGFQVLTPAEAHLCCGSAGTYNILQPELAGRLGGRKAANLDRLAADVVATGNIGCAVQIGMRSARPVVHIVQLVDWATGGPRPDELAELSTGEG